MQWGALQDVARTITLLLEKSGESHRKCPRCRGTGLVQNSFIRLEKGAHPNQPCWFCEGIGALPIAGLNGFVLARTTPCLKALDNHSLPHVDVLLRNHSRYGGEECKFTNGKLGVNLADLFYDFNMPPWINCSSLGCQQNVLENSKAKESIFQPRVSEQRLQPLSTFSHKEPCLRNGFFQRILNAPLVLSIVSGSQSNNTLSHSPSSVTGLQPSGVLVPVDQKAAKVCPMHKVRVGFAMQHAASMQKTSYRSVSTLYNVHLESEFLGPFVTKSQTQASVLSTKRRRLQRKARNSIREKARKEAQERARGVMRTLKHKDELGSANSHVQPECTETNSKSLQGPGAHADHFFPSDMAPRGAWLTTVAVLSRQVLLSRLIADGLQALMPTTANLMR